MAINFFEDEKVVNDVRFGICDDVDVSVKTPAYVDLTHEARWVAKVTNNSGCPVGFIAVDNKIEMRRENGEMENRCDAMLHNDIYVIFVELKDQTKNWIKRAVEEQLLTTINIFKANHDISKYRYRIAYACNKRHPVFAVSQKEYMQRFKKEHNVRLIIGCDIVLKANG